jgi:rhodanese-related sulfurtransferase
MEREKAERISVEQAREEIAGGELQAVDSRPQEDWLDAHIPGAVQAPDGEIHDEEIRTKAVLAIAEDDDAEAVLCVRLQESGYEVKTLKGGFKEWKSSDATIQPSDDPDTDVPVDPDPDPVADDPGDDRIEETDVEGAGRA